MRPNLHLFWRPAPILAALLLASPAAADDPAPVPLSDPENVEGWVLNEDVSDEFEDGEIDREKWIIQGEDGRYHTWRGRAPSQFAGHNVFARDGKMVLRSQWEPEFDFHDGESGGARYGDEVAPVTAAAVISRHRFLYGYMEARTKASNSNMTSSFWTLGYQSELDMYEQMGNPKKEGGTIEANTLNSAIHDWRPGRYTPGFGQNKTFNNKHRLGFRVADDFHVYGTEWDPNFLRFFVDGKLIKEVSREEIGDGWVLTNPLELWFDTEIFRWLGYPHPEELPADYEIDYVRVWQKPSPEKLAPAFFGFEGPKIYSQFDRPLIGEDREKNKFAQDWYFHGAASKHFAIVENENQFAGKRSLKLTHTGNLPDGGLTAFAPYGSIEIPAGEYALSLRVFVPAEAQSTILRILLEEPWQQLPAIDLANLPRDEWVKLNFEFSRRSHSGEMDRLRLGILAPDKSAGGTFYFDQISIQPAK